MDKKEIKKVLDAIDVVCLNCVEDTLKDNSCCKSCPVRKTADSLRLQLKKVKAREFPYKEDYLSLKEGDDVWIASDDGTVDHGIVDYVSKTEERIIRIGVEFPAYDDDYEEYEHDACGTTLFIDIDLAENAAAAR